MNSKDLTTLINDLTFGFNSESKPAYEKSVAAERKIRECITSLQAKVSDEVPMRDCILDMRDSLKDANRLLQSFYLGFKASGQEYTDRLNKKSPLVSHFKIIIKCLETHNTDKG